MLDPVTIGLAFSAAKTALGYIREGVDLYKEAAEVGADVADIAMDVGKHIGNFMDNHTVVRKAVEQQKNTPPKKGEKSLSSQALNNVMMQRELENAAKEIREYLIYQTPGLGGIWTDYQAEMARLEKMEKEEEERIRKEEELARKKAAELKRRFKENVHVYLALIGAVVTISVYLWALVELIELDRARRWGF